MNSYAANSSVYEKFRNKPNIQQEAVKQRYVITKLHQAQWSIVRSLVNPSSKDGTKLINHENCSHSSYKYC